MWNLDFVIDSKINQKIDERQWIFNHFYGDLRPLTVSSKTFLDSMLLKEAKKLVRELKRDKQDEYDDACLMRMQIRDSIEIKHHAERLRELLKRLTWLNDILNEKKVALDAATVKESVDFKALIERYCPDAKVKGDKVTARCCLHSDKTPSFSANLRKKTWYCFAGCGGGDVITLVMKVENLTFPQALKFLMSL